MSRLASHSRRSRGAGSTPQPEPMRRCPPSLAIGAALLVLLRGCRHVVVGVGDGDRVVGDRLVAVVHVVVGAVPRPVEPAVDRQLAALVDRERTLVEVDVRPEVVAGLERHVGRLRRPVAAGDDEADAVEVADQGQARRGRRVDQRSVGQRSPRPAGRSGLVARWAQAVRGRHAETRAPGGRVRHDAVEDRAITPAKMRAIRTRAVDEKIEKAADAGFRGKDVFAGRTAPHRRNLVDRLPDTDADVLAALVPAAIVAHDLAPHRQHAVLPQIVSEAHRRARRADRRRRARACRPSAPGTGCCRE